MLNNTDNDLCLTKYKYNITNNLFNNYSDNKCNSNTNDYKQLLYIPPVGINSENILKIYSINSSDSLILWIETNMHSSNILTINRILNCWIINNIEILKNHNNFLKNIYNNLILKYSNSNIIKLINNNIIDLDKDTLYFIDDWINKYNNEFTSNLLYDYFNYLNIKYL